MIPRSWRRVLAIGVIPAVIPAAILAVVVSPAAAGAGDPGPPVQRCVITDPRLTGLSGLATDGDRLYAAPDHPERIAVFVLDPANCQVQRVITTEVEPHDVGDLALDSAGTLWVADTGDNRAERDTVALYALTATGAVTEYRMRYPDGPHDVEALLVDRDGTPHLVTKNPLGSAGVYRPPGPLTAPGPTPLERVGTVHLGPTDTPGGPALPLGVGSVLVTGGAVNTDGTVIALRTYTDAYLFTAPDGDIPAALQREPLRVPLPDEPQGEAIAFESNGTLLSSGEFGAGGTSVPLRAVPNAAAQVAVADTTRSEPDTPTPHPRDRADPPAPAQQQAHWQILLLAGAATLIALVPLTRLARKLTRRGNN